MIGCEEVKRNWRACRCELNKQSSLFSSLVLICMTCLLLGVNTTNLELSIHRCRTPENMLGRESRLVYEEVNYFPSLPSSPQLLSCQHETFSADQQNLPRDSRSRRVALCIGYTPPIAQGGDTYSSPGTQKYPCSLYATSESQQEEVQDWVAGFVFVYSLAL